MYFGSGEQIAGIRNVSFFLLEEVENWPLVVNDTNALQIIINPLEVDVKGDIEFESIRINDKPKLTEEGEIWPIIITFNFLYRGPEIEYRLDQYANKPGICIAGLNYGSQKLYGTNLEPLYLSFENDTGERLDDLSVLKITIKGETRQRPMFYIPPANVTNP